MSLGTILGIGLIIAFAFTIIDGATKPHRRSVNMHNNDNAGCLGCSIIIAILFCLWLVSIAIDFIKAHSTLFIIGSVATLFVGSIIFITYKMGDTNKSDFTNTVYPKITDFPKHSQPSTSSNPTQPTHTFLQAVEEPKIPSAAEIAGKDGENDVCRAIYTACQFDKRHYRIMRNVYIPKKNGKYSEIDALLLHETGIYVFESKNLSGDIYGETNNPQWLQCKKNGEQVLIANPIKQNEGHIFALKNFLEDGKQSLRVFSIIVFGLKAKLHNIPEDTPFTTTHEIFNLETDLIKKFESESACYNTETIDSWFKTLLHCIMLSEKEKQAHIDSISRKNDKPT